MTETILIAIALVLVFEGILYTLFPEAMQRMMRMALDLPPEQLRMIGLFVALTGVTLVWLFQLL